MELRIIGSGFEQIYFIDPLELCTRVEIFPNENPVGSRLFRTIFQKNKMEVEFRHRKNVHRSGELKNCLKKIIGG